MYRYVCQSCFWAQVGSFFFFFVDVSIITPKMYSYYNIPFFLLFLHVTPCNKNENPRCSGLKDLGTRLATLAFFWYSPPWRPSDSYDRQMATTYKNKKCRENSLVTPGALESHRKWLNWSCVYYRAQDLSLWQIWSRLD